MKLNAKDIASGVILILFAAVALWLNQDHSLGSARRMGPGYMPMLVFWILLGLGIIILGSAFFNGPDPMQKWSGIDSASLGLAIVAGYGAFLVAPQISSYFATGYGNLGVGMLVGFLVICWSERWRLIGYICAGLCIFSPCCWRRAGCCWRSSPPSSSPASRSRSTGSGRSGWSACRSSSSRCAGGSSSSSSTSAWPSGRSSSHGASRGIHG